MTNSTNSKRGNLKFSFIITSLFPSSTLSTDKLILIHPLRVPGMVPNKKKDKLNVAYRL